MVLPVGSLNHMELVYRPGERELAEAIFRLFGCNVRGTTVPTMFVADEHIYVSEVLAEQWEFEQAVTAALDSGALVASYRAFGPALSHQPQRYHHFGFGFATLSEWGDAVARVDEAGTADPDLRGRIGVAATFRPGDPGSFGDDFVQAFVRTDVFSVGLLALGQTVELQHFYANDPAGRDAVPATAGV